MKLKESSLTPGDLARDVRLALEDGLGVEERLFESDMLEGVETATLEFDGCLFRSVGFNACDIGRLYFTDCRFERCDLSGLRLRDGSIRRTEFIACRFSGATFDGMILRDVLFEECQMSYASFARCRLKDARFDGCQLERLLLHGCEQSGLRLPNCRLTEAEIVDTRLSGVDLTTCDLSGLRASIDSFRGATVSLAQSPQLLALCGVEVDG